MDKIYSLSMGFSGQEYQSVQPFSFPGNFPNPGIEPRSLKLQVDSLAAEPNPDTILKSRDTTLLTKVRIVKALVYPVVMYGCESWTIKKSGCQRIDALGLWCWRRLLRVPQTARRSNQSILKGINPEQSLERLMLKLKLQYFGHLLQRANSLEKTTDAGKD